MLDERDALWVDLRHKHWAAASLDISARMDALRAANAKSGGGGGGRAGGAGGAVGDLNLRNMSKLIQSLPQYRCVCVWGGYGEGGGSGRKLRLLAEQSPLHHHHHLCAWERRG